MRPHCPGSGRLKWQTPSPPESVATLCPYCKRTIRLRLNGTMHYHVAKLRKTAKIRDDARGTP